MEEIRLCPKHGSYRGNSCDCGHQGEVMLDREKVEKLGRFISGALRHFSSKLNLDMDENGWIDFDQLVKAISQRYPWSNREMIISILESDKKNRYELKQGRIRAKYGHSINVKLDDYPLAEEERLYYGTGEEEAHRILEIGLKPVNQTFVHLSTTREKSERVAGFHTERPVILVIDAESARNEGIKFLKANEYIVLTKEIPPEYLERLI